MAAPRLNFNRTTVVDPTRGAIQGLTGAQQTLANWQSNNLKEEQMAATLAQQDLANKRADAQLAISQGIAQREKEKYEAGLAQDTILSNILKGNAPKEVVSTKSIGGTPSNAPAIKAANDFNANVQLEQDLLGFDLIDAEDKFSSIAKDGSLPAGDTTGGVTVSPQYKSRANGLSNLVNNVHTGASGIDATGQRMLNVIKVPNAVDTIGAFLGDASNNLFGTSFGKKVLEGPGAIHDPIAPPIGTNVTAAQVRASGEITDAHKKMAMKESGLDAINERLSALDSSKKKVPDLIKATKGDVKTFTKATTPVEQANFLRDKIRNSDLTGKNKITALKEVDVLYPEAKPLTETEKLNRLKYEDIITENSSAIKDIKAIYPEMPKNVSSLKGAMTWVNDQISKRAASSKIKDKSPTAQEVALAKVYKNRVDSGWFTDDDTSEYDNALSIIQAAEVKMGLTPTKDERW